jgi:hypothetical protein
LFAQWLQLGTLLAHNPADLIFLRVGHTDFLERPHHVPPVAKSVLATAAVNCVAFDRAGDADCGDQSDCCATRDED